MIKPQIAIQEKDPNSKPAKQSKKKEIYVINGAQKSQKSTRYAYIKALKNAQLPNKRSEKAAKENKPQKKQKLSSKSIEYTSVR